jgi:hypothetical protein
LSLLDSYGYLIVRLPKADVKPMQILLKQGKDLDRIGELTTLLQTGNTIPLPQIIENLPAANISGQRTGDLKIGIGVSLLSSILSAMGGSSASLATKYRQAVTLTFEFHDVLEDRVEIAKIDQYLADADLNPFSRYLSALLEADQLYITTATIKSHKFTVEAKKSDGGTLALSIPEIQNAAGGNVKVSSQVDTTSRITYEGNIPLVFGFQAVQLFYNQGHYTAFESLSGLAMRHGEPVLNTTVKKLVSEGPFLRLRGE